MRRLMSLLVLAVAGATVLVGAAAADGDSTQTWTVRITNLTGGQPLSPPLLVVHSNKADVWSVGEIASHGLAAIAEDANNSVLVSALPQLSGVLSATTGAGGPIPPGATASYSFESSGSYNRLSLLTMLVNTNDAFTGLDSERLRRARPLTMAYDAGSEANNEKAMYIPGPCCGNPFERAPEGELIRHHPGITGVGDLDPAVYGWSGPVARIVIEQS